MKRMRRIQRDSFTAGLFSCVLCLVAVLPSPVLGSDFALRTSFVYEADLDFRGQPADGIFDFEFELFDQRANGTLLGREVRSAYTVTDGVLQVELDFGQSVTSEVRWLQISVREAGSGAYTMLEPRQRVTGRTVCTVDGDLEVTGNIGAKGNKISFLDGTGAIMGGLAYANSIVGQRLIFTTEDTDRAWIDPDGHFGIGTAFPSVPLEVTGGTDASLSGGGEMLAGDVSGYNLIFDGNEIIARNNGAAAQLNLNAGSGTVATGSNLSVGGTLTATGDATVYGTLSFGAGGTLDINYIRYYGGECFPAGYCDASCPPGTVILSGGCDNAGGAVPADNGLISSYPISETEWRCSYADGTGLHIYVWLLCADIAP